MSIVYGAFADEYGASLAEQIEGLTINGIRHLEIRFVDGINISQFDDEQVVKTGNALSENGIKVFSIGSPAGKISVDDDFGNHIVMFKKICTYAKVLGAKYIRVFSFYNKPGLPQNDFREISLSRLDKLLNIAENNNLILCHENESKIYGESPVCCRELLDYFGGRMRCVFDMGNFVLDGYDPLKAYDLLYDFIEYFHIKDGTPDGKITIPGYGQAKIKEILKDYDAKHDFTYMTLEPHLKGFTGLSHLTDESRNQVPDAFKSNKEAFNYAFKSVKALINDI